MAALQKQLVGQGSHSLWHQMASKCINFAEYILKEKTGTIGRQGGVRQPPPPLKRVHCEKKAKALGE